LGQQGAAKVPGVVPGSAGIHPRIAWITEVRGFLALYVVLHHAALNIDRSGQHDGLWQVVDLLFGWGHPRVDVFFVLSAFCLALPLGTSGRFPNFSTFFLRRSLRLLPSYYAACVLGLLLITLIIGTQSGTHWDVSVPVTMGGLLSHALLIHQWWPEFGSQINHPLWSIGVEFQLCLLLPLLVWSCGRFGPWMTMCVFTIVGYLAWRFTLPFGFPDPSPWGASLYYVSLFAMGIAAAYLYCAPPERWRLRGVERVALPGVVIGMATWLAWQAFHGHYVTKQVLSFFVGAATVAVILASRGWHNAEARLPGRARRSLAYVGKRSYSLYLVHAPLLQVVWVALVRPLHLRSSGAQSVVMMVLGSAIAVAFSLFFFDWVERPSVDWSRRVGEGANGRLPTERIA
jgi:peptidoglycan/LPS O-acetylase OafA/YrhL